MKFWKLSILIVALTPSVVCSGRAANNSPAAYGLYERPGRMVQIATGNRLSLYCLGRGQPTIFLESGYGEAAYSTWARLHVPLSRLTRTCSYDRAGFGFSELGHDLPRTLQRETADLYSLIERSKEPGPFILMGHSNGGHLISAFTALHPKEVSGLVFLDAAVLLDKPNLFGANAEAKNLPTYAEKEIAHIKHCRRQAFAAQSGSAPTRTDDCLQHDITDLSPAMAKTIQGFESNSRYWTALLSETLEEYRTTDLRWESHLLPYKWEHLPILVFTASTASFGDEEIAPAFGIPSSDTQALHAARAGRAQWEKLQSDICKLSLECHFTPVATISHAIQDVASEQVVQETALLLDRLKKSTGVSHGNRI